MVVNRVYYFDTPAGIAEIQQSIDFLYTREEMVDETRIDRMGNRIMVTPGIESRRREQPGYMTIPRSIISATGRGKAISSGIMVREYFRNRRQGDYEYKLFAMWRSLCRIAGYKVPAYGHFRTMCYLLRRLQLIKPTNPTPPHLYKVGTETTVVPPVAANKTMLAVTRFGLSKYEYLVEGVEGDIVRLDAIDRMWRDPWAAVYHPFIEMRSAAGKYLTPAQIEAIGWP
jgi:hypothetical protein